MPLRDGGWGGVHQNLHRLWHRRRHLEDTARPFRQHIGGQDQGCRRHPHQEAMEAYLAQGVDRIGASAAITAYQDE